VVRDRTVAVAVDPAPPLSVVHKDGSNAPILKSPVADDTPVASRVLTSSRLVTGKKMKTSILVDYQGKFGSGYSEPITTQTTQGTLSCDFLRPPSQFHLVRSSRMKPDPNKHYSVDRLSIETLSC